MDDGLMKFCLAMIRMLMNPILRFLHWVTKTPAVKLVLVIVPLLLLHATTAGAIPATLHWCSVTIKHATSDELLLELWSTSQSTRYSVDINYSRAPCFPWDGHEENWIEREYLSPGLYTLPWSDFYDEHPSPGMEACINWTCQPEVTVIYWSQDYQMVLGYLYLPLLARG